MSYYYIATPFSKYPGGLDAAYAAACEQTALLIRAGVPAFSPVAHSYGIALCGGLDPKDHSIWLPADAPMMLAAAALIVCKLPTWNRSFGIKVEIEAFYRAGKPIFYMEPGVVPGWAVSADEAHA